MITFKELVSGNRFFLNDVHAMKLSAELANFDRMDDGQQVRTTLSNKESGYTAMARLAIVFNAVDLNTGNLLSILDDQEIRLGDDANYSEYIDVPEEAEPKETKDYSF